MTPLPHHPGNPCPHLGKQTGPLPPPPHSSQGAAAAVLPESHHPKNRASVTALPKRSPSQRRKEGKKTMAAAVEAWSWKEPNK